MRKMVTAFFAAALMTAVFAVPASAGVWKNDAVGYWYENDDGSIPKGKEAAIDGAYYAFDANGYMLTGWQYMNYKWKYYGPTGARVTGWQQVDGKWYYLDPANDGGIKVGWMDLNGARYYFDNNGAMQTGSFSVDNGDGVVYSYRADASGAIIRNQTVDNGDGKVLIFGDDGVIYYKTADSANAGIDDDNGGVRLLLEGEDQAQQKADDAERVRIRVTETLDSLYRSYKRRMKTNNSSRRVQLRKEWETLAEQKLGEFGLSASEISEYIYKIEYGNYVPSDEGGDEYGLEDEYEEEEEDEDYFD